MQIESRINKAESTNLPDVMPRCSLSSAKIMQIGFTGSKFHRFSCLATLLSHKERGGMAQKRRFFLIILLLIVILREKGKAPQWSH
ncbi:MAG: hypothetical protein ACI4TW_02570 [Prevotella sp.]